MRNQRGSAGLNVVTVALVAPTEIWSNVVSEPESDLDLVTAVKNDPSAFGQLYERYVNRIYNYVYYRTGNHHDAEDLTSRVFYRALMHVDEYVDRGVPFSARLYRIAHNLVANWHRDHARRQDVDLDDAQLVGEPQEMPEVVAEDNERRRWLLAAIRRLPEERQELLILKFVEQLSNAEVGQIMGRTEGAIKSLYHRTLLALRDELIQIDVGLEEVPLGVHDAGA
jgi:RNA polymerase sigma-70 factor (ECF subfamily)